MKTLFDMVELGEHSVDDVPELLGCVDSTYLISH